MKKLIQAVLDDPVAALRDHSDHADQLVAAGPVALPYIEDVLKGNWSSSAHPVDVMEAFQYLAKRIHDAEKRGF
jgi:hypothetical protein